MIRAKDAPQKPLSCFPSFSSQHDSFLSTPPFPSCLPLPLFCHTLAHSVAYPRISAHNLTPEENELFLLSIQSICLSYTRSDLFCVQLFLGFVPQLFTLSLLLISLLIHPCIYIKSLSPGSYCSFFCDCTVQCSVPPHQADCFLSGCTAVGAPGGAPVPHI